MTFKSETQPLCRYCGGKIKKVTQTRFLFQSEWQARIDPDFVPRKFNRAEAECIYPKTREEAQRLFNHPIVHVTYAHPKERGIEKVSVWDGESYEDEFFCSGTHARWFANAMALQGWATKEYNDAAGGA